MSRQMCQWLGVLRSPRGCIVRALIAAGQSDRELLEEFRKRLLSPRRQEAHQPRRRGLARGELPRGLDLDLVLDILYGAIYMRFLIRHDELSERYIEELCRLVLDGAAARNASSSHRNHPKSRRNGVTKNGAALARRGD